MDSLIFDVLGLPDLRVTEQENEKYTDADGNQQDMIVFSVEHKNYTPICESCAAEGLKTMVQGHDKSIRRVRDYDAHGFRVELNVPVRRFKCLSCGKTFSETFESIDSNARLTNRLREEIVKKALDRPFLQIANEYGLAHTTVKASFNQWLEKQDANRAIYAPKVLGIDEAHLVNEMRGVITDNENNQILDILSTRDVRHIKKFFSSMLEPSNLQAVTMDMYRPYRDAVYEIFGSDVYVVVDHFHVIQMVTKATNAVRVKLKTQVPSDDKRLLRRDRHLMLTNMEDLSKADMQELTRLFKKYPQFQTAYGLKEGFRSIYNCKTRIDAELAFSKWANEVPKNDPQFSEFVSLIGTVKRWYTEIFNYFDHPYTNAFTESYNGIIKKVNRAGNGYSFETLRAKMLYGSSATHNNSYRSNKRNGTTAITDGAQSPRQSTVKTPLTFEDYTIDNKKVPNAAFSSYYHPKKARAQSEKDEMRGFGVDVKKLCRLIATDKFFDQDQ